MDFIDFDPAEKKDWFNKQARISSNVLKGLKLAEGFACAFFRRGTEEYKKIEALLHKPTDSQRGYYWSTIIPMIRKEAELHGQFYKSDKELHSDIKQIMMEEYGVYVEKVSKINGKKYREEISVSDAKGDRENTRKFIDAVIIWAASFYGIVIPEPNIKK